MLLLVSFYQMGMLAFSVILQEIADAFSEESYGKNQAVVTLPDFFHSRYRRDIFSFPRAMSQVPCLHEHLANAARVRYPAALLRCKFDAPSACCGVFDSSFLQISIWAVIHEWFCGTGLQKMLGRQNAAVAWGGIAVVVGTGIFDGLFEIDL